MPLGGMVALPLAISAFQRVVGTSEAPLFISCLAQRGTSETKRDGGVFFGERAHLYGKRMAEKDSRPLRVANLSAAKRF